MTGPEPALLKDVLGDRIFDLVPGHVETLAELLELEHARAVPARRWAVRRRKPEQVASMDFLVQLHQQLYNGIWRWAGVLRRSDHAEGVRWPTIGIELTDVLGEVRFWVERRLYSPDELALRFFHRLLRIRVWEGGNGSHARLAADALVVSLGRPPFAWGLVRGAAASDARPRYTAALREADAGLFQPLIAFARGVQ